MRQRLPTRIAGSLPSCAIIWTIRRLTRRRSATSWGVIRSGGLSCSSCFRCNI